MINTDQSIAIIRKLGALLDKVMSRNQWHIGAKERHLMLKELHMRPYMVKKKVCLEQNISIGSHCMEKGHLILHFSTFNVSVQVKW